VNNGPKYGDDIINDGKQFSIDEESSGNVDPFSDESSYSSRFSIEDDKDLEEESTYLTEENQKRFFPEPGTQEVELGYRVGAKLEDTRDKRKESTYLTGESEGIPSPKRRPPSPSDDSKPSITSMDEDAYSGSNDEWGKSANELMEEVMRIAREQEERNNR